MQPAEYEQCYKRVMGSHRMYIVLPDEQVATLIDVSTSKTYVEVLYGDPVQKTWMRRDELTVVGS